MKHKLRSLYLTWLLDDRSIAIRRMLFECWRAVTFRKRVVSVFLQLDDPYSYLLCHYLGHVITRYKKVEFRFYLCQALRGDYMPEPAMLSEYAFSDCVLLARELGVSLPGPWRHTGGGAQDDRCLNSFAAEHDEEDFGETFIKAMTHYWRGDAEAVARMMGRTYGESAETNVLVGKNQLLLRKLGHYNCATLHYAGEWYWGRRPAALPRRALRPARAESIQGNKCRSSPRSNVRGISPYRRRNPRAQRRCHHSRCFIRFAAPYSYIALSHIFEIADAFGLTLDIRPVLPMVMRGVSLPQSKLMYIVKDANREAKASRKCRFGKIADSLGPGSERCIAAFYYAKEDGRERDFLLEAGKAIFADAIDVATDEGMQVVAERAGLFWPELQEAMKDEGLAGQGRSQSRSADRGRSLGRARHCASGKRFSGGRIATGCLRGRSRTCATAAKASSNEHAGRYFFTRTGKRALGDKKSDPWRETVRAMGCEADSVDYQGIADPGERADKLIAFCEHIAGPIVLVGSSMGGHVATAAAERVNAIGLFVLAPAYYMEGYESLTPGAPGIPISIVHGWHDDVVPLENSIRYAKECSATLHVVDGDHRLTGNIDDINVYLARFIDSLA